MNSGNADRCEWLRVAVNGNATGSLSFVLLEQQQQCKIDNNRRRRRRRHRQRRGWGGSEGDVAVGSQSHKLYFLLPAQRSLLSERAGEGMRFETSHTLLSAAHATASHSPSLAPFFSLPLSHVSATLEWANVSCVLSTVSPALREREKDKKREGREECDTKRVLKFCLAALPTSLLLLSVVAFFVLLHNQRSFDCLRSSMCVCVCSCVCVKGVNWQPITALTVVWQPF